MRCLVAFGVREGVTPVVKTVICHVQFEVICLSIDSSGRTGRALLHRMVATDELFLHTMLPVSCGPPHDGDGCMDALDACHGGVIE